MDNKLSKPKKLTEKWLDEAFEELKKYQAVLQQWDTLLDNREAMLDAWEAELAAFAEGHDGEFEDEDCEYDVNHIPEAIQALEKRSGNKVRIVTGPEGKVLYMDEGTRKDIAELERLYKLPDKRRKEKR